VKSSRSAKFGRNESLTQAATYVEDIQAPAIVFRHASSRVVQILDKPKFREMVQRRIY
jgi:aspartate carbamoyltransferase catalytic subunit